MKTAKIGCAVITCDREHLLQQCLDSVNACQPDELVVVNDCVNELSKINLGKAEIIQHKENLGVAQTKYDAFEYLLKKGCDHIFIIEDDVKMLYQCTLETYIKCSEVTKLQHLIYGYHGPANKDQYGEPKPRLTAEHKDDISIAFNRHCIGAFCYYSRECLEKVGLPNVKYINAFDHVEHSYRIAKAGYCTPYWWWPDISNSTQFITDCDGDLKLSVIRKDMNKLQVNLRGSVDLFAAEHGYTPITVPDTPQSNIIDFMRKLSK